MKNDGLRSWMLSRSEIARMSSDEALQLFDRLARENDQFLDWYKQSYSEDCGFWLGRWFLGDKQRYEQGLWNIIGWIFYVCLGSKQY